jgi:hypothetical protein
LVSIVSQYRSEDFFQLVFMLDVQDCITYFGKSSAPDARLLRRTLGRSVWVTAANFSDRRGRTSVTGLSRLPVIAGAVPPAEKVRVT